MALLPHGGPLATWPLARGWDQGGVALVPLAFALPLELSTNKLCLHVNGLADLYYCIGKNQVSR